MQRFQLLDIFLTKKIFSLDAFFARNFGIFKYLLLLAYFVYIPKNGPRDIKSRIFPLFRLGLYPVKGHYYQTFRGVWRAIRLPRPKGLERETASALGDGGTGAAWRESNENLKQRSFWNSEKRNGLETR